MPPAQKAAFRIQNLGCALIFCMKQDGREKGWENRKKKPRRKATNLKYPYGTKPTGIKTDIGLPLCSESAISNVST
jgi:hypothetical protein